jgi:competence protein ComEA
MFKKILVALLALVAAAAFAAVDVNKATQAELDGVKGIGPAISAKIIDARKTGDFKDWPDLIGRVKGIGDVNAGKFSEAGLTVGGASFKGAAPAAKKDDTKAMSKADKKAKADDAKVADAAKPADAAASKPARKSKKDKAAAAAADAASKPAKK